MAKNELENRMKLFYENANKLKLTRRTPVIIRLDGCHFHTFTRGFIKPFDTVLVETMQQTMKYLCENIQGVVLGYTQSDEISLVLVDYKTLTSGAWFDYDLQKICSVSASIATFAFNKYFVQNVKKYFAQELQTGNRDAKDLFEDKYIKTLSGAIRSGAIFDARAFNIPEEEVTNCIFWRQLDAERNSVASVTQAHFSPKKLQGLNIKAQKALLETECNIVWDNLETYLKRGSCCVKNNENGQWVIDLNIPRFIADDRNYIEKLL